MKVCFIYSDRSEYSMLEPFIDYFEQHASTRVLDLSKEISVLHDDRNLHKIYQKCYEVLSSEKFNFLCILGDRRELPFIALAAFFLGIKIVHIAAGEFVKETPTYDQLIRPVVSLLSSFQICFSEKAKKRVIKLFKGSLYLQPNAHLLGSPVFKGIKIKELKRLVKERYDLVLLHPQSLNRKNTISDINNVRNKLKDKKTIFISGNRDRNSDLIKNFYKNLKTQNKRFSFVDSLPKQKYFRLVRYCDNFYTNSSSISEIKLLNRYCLRRIGIRNAGRPEHKFNNKAPEQLYRLLKKHKIITG